MKLSNYIAHAYTYTFLYAYTWAFKRVSGGDWP